MTSCIAVDLGASSYRIILNNEIETIELYRSNDHLETIDNKKYWNICNIYNAIITALDSIADISSVESIAINSWGCDFVFLDQTLNFDENNKLISPIYGNCYLNSEKFVDENIFSENELFELTGIKSQKFNTINRYKLLDRPITFIASYINYLLTGYLEADYTIASTTQLLDKVENSYNEHILQKLNISKENLPPLKSAGSTVKNIKIQRFSTIKVIFGPGHDTAYALNHGTDKSLVLNIGSWIIIGTNIDSTPSFNCCYSYERGLKKKYKVVINQIGMNGFNQLMHESQLKISYDELYDEMMTVDKELKYSLEKENMDFTEYYLDEPWEARLAGYLQSLVNLTITNIKQFIFDINPDIDTLYIVGGGSQNRFFIEKLLLNLPSEINVEFGPQEATVMGNIKYQREIENGTVTK